MWGFWQAPPRATRLSGGGLFNWKRQGRFDPFLDEAGLEAADGWVFGEVGVGEVVVGGHVGGDDEGEDVEGAGDVEEELDVGACGEAAAEAVAFLGRVTLELDVDDGRERLAGGPVGEDRDVGGDGAAGAKATDSPGDGRGRAADLLGELIGGLEIVVLESREQAAVERVECLPHGAA